MRILDEKPHAKRVAKANQAREANKRKAAALALKMADIRKNNQAVIAAAGNATDAGATIANTHPLSSGADRGVATGNKQGKGQADGADRRLAREMTPAAVSSNHEVAVTLAATTGARTVSTTTNAAANRENAGASIRCNSVSSAANGDASTRAMASGGVPEAALRAESSDPELGRGCIQVVEDENVSASADKDTDKCARDRSYRHGFTGLRSAYGSYSSIFSSQVRAASFGTFVQYGSVDSTILPSR